LHAPIILPKTTPYNVLRDFYLFAILPTSRIVLVVRPTLDCKTLEDLIAYAKKNPGKLLAATSGTATPNLIDTEVSRLPPERITSYNFEGGGEVTVNLLGGHVDLSFLTINGVRSQVKAGTLEPWQCSQRKGFPIFPTFRDQGKRPSGVKDQYEFQPLGPKGLPKEITEKVADTMDRVLKSPEMISTLKSRGYVINFLSGKACQERAENDIKFYTEIATKAGL